MPVNDVAVTTERVGVARHRRASLFLTIVVVNVVVTAVVALAAALVAARLSTVVVIGGAGLSALANALVLTRALRQLRALGQAMEAVHTGELERRVAVEALDPGLHGLARAFNAMCARLTDESHRYAAGLTGAVEEERRRIGRELHDQTSQTLAATLVNLDLASKALDAGDLRAARERVAGAEVLVGHSIEEIKRLVYDLRPVMLDDIGLAPTLRWYIKSHLQDAGPAIVADFDGATLRLPGEVETALYRIAQEVLTNAVRHAAATKIVIRLEVRPGYADLAVIDNGRGFDPETTLHDPARRGVGLLSIKERVELLGGTVNVVSEIGRGTRVYTVIPFDTDQPAEQP